MISHEFFQISEGFRTSDESDLIGSKLLHSPRSKGDFVPIKYSSSIDNSRYFANYAEKFERQNPQSMKVVTFQSEPKVKVQGSKLIVTKQDDAKANEKREQNQSEKETGSSAGAENGKPNSIERMKIGQNNEVNGEVEEKSKEENKGKEEVAKHTDDGEDAREGKEKLSQTIEEPKSNNNEKMGQQKAPVDSTTDEEKEALKENDKEDTERDQEKVEKEQEKEIDKEQDKENNKKENGKENNRESIDKVMDNNATTENNGKVKGDSKEIEGKIIVISNNNSDKQEDTVAVRPSPRLSAKATVEHKPHLPTISMEDAEREKDKKEQEKLEEEKDKEQEKGKLPESDKGEQKKDTETLFSKDMGFKIKVSSPVQPSALSMSLMERAHKKGFQGSRLQIPEYHVPCLQLIVFILIHSSYLPNKLNNLRVPPNATVEYVIDIAVKKLNDLIEKHRPEDPPLVPSKCQLLLAEEDGRPDTDTPVLQRDAAVHRFGCMYFALCKDPESEGGGYTADTKTFKVLLPTKEYQVLSYKRTLSLGQVLEKVCNKRQLDPLVHYLVYTPSNGSKEVEVNLDTLVSDIDSPEVTIKCRMQSRKMKNPLRPTLRSRSRHEIFSSDGGDSLAPPVLNPKVSRHLGVPKEFFWSPASVSTHVQYTVIKINKYGKKQERIMGIDRERITNSMPLNKPSIKTKMPTRMMTEVQKAFIADRPIPASPSSRKPFSIEFSDHIQEYESDKADEIVARINYILSLESKQKQRADE